MLEIEGIEDELERLRIDFEAQKADAEGIQESILKLLTKVRPGHWPLLSAQPVRPLLIPQSHMPCLPCSCQVKEMQKRLTDATIYLPPYDVRRAQEVRG